MQTTQHKYNGEYNAQVSRSLQLRGEKQELFPTSFVFELTVPKGLPLKEE